jgi:hypothetical protein
VLVLPDEGPVGGTPISGIGILEIVLSLAGITASGRASFPAKT